MGKVKRERLKEKDREIAHDKRVRITKSFAERKRKR
jgi:hypothetical protein